MPKRKGIDYPPHVATAEEDIVNGTVAPEKQEEQINTDSDFEARLAKSDEAIKAESARMKSRAEELYFGLADEVRASGVAPSQVSSILKPAYAGYLKMKALSKNLEKATTNEELDKMTDRFDSLETQFIDELAVNAGAEVTRLTLPVKSAEQASGQEVAVASKNEVMAQSNEAEEPIVMVNDVLTKIAYGGKLPKKAKARKPHKSVSEGGTVYKGKVFESSDEEPTDVKALTYSAPETRAEYKAALRRTVEEIDTENPPEAVAIPEPKHTNDNLPVPIPAYVADPKIINFQAEREARMKAKETQNKKKWSWRGALAALGLLAASAPDDLAAATHMPTHNAAHASASAERTATEGISVSIDKNGEGADFLFKELQKKLKEKHPAGARIPDTVTKKLMEAHPHELSNALHFIRDNGKESAWMHPGDSLEVNTHGQLVFHEHAKGADHSQILMESGIASARVVNFYTGHYQPAHTEHHAVHAPTHTEGAPHAALETHETNPQILAEYAKEHADYATTMAKHAPVKVPAPAVQTTQSPSAHESAPVQESQPVQTPTAHAAESGVTNSHGIHIDKSAPHMYEDARGALIIYGGSSEQQLKMVNEFFKERSNRGKTLLVVTSKIDPMTGQPDLSSFSINESGKAQLTPVLTDAENAVILPPTEDELVKKVQ